MLAEGAVRFRRHVRRALDATCDTAIVGGVLAMPVGGLAAVVSPMLPTGGLPHHCEGLIYGIAVLWFVAALIGAHMRHPSWRSTPNGPDA